MGAYPGGVWLVELAGISEPELVSQAVAAALGVTERPGQRLVDTLVDVLGARQALLVLDNCEHLVEAVATLVNALLDRCPRLRILATTREALRVQGELRWPVPTLSVPGPHDAFSAVGSEVPESARLFAERARFRDPTFVLGPENATWEAAFVEGQAKGLDEAIDYALSARLPSTPPVPSPDTSRVRVATLTRREEEIADLVARGMTNRQIAAELTLSRHTVANHVARILSELGVDSRSHITAWVVERRTRR